MQAENRTDRVYLPHLGGAEPYESDSSLGRVDELLQEIASFPKTKEPLELSKQRNIKLNNLEEAYDILLAEVSKNPQQPPKEVALRLADVMRQRGQMCYANPNYKEKSAKEAELTKAQDSKRTFEVAKQMLLPALNLYLYATGAADLLVDFTDPNMATFPNLLEHVEKNIIAGEPPYTYLGEVFSGIGFDVLSEKAAHTDLNAGQQFSYAYTLRWLNGAFRTSHERGECRAEEETLRQERHAKFLCLAMDILQSEPHSVQKTREMLDLRYNDMPGYYRLIKDTEQYEKNYEWLIANAQDDEDLRRTYNKRALGEPEGSAKREEYFALAQVYEAKIKQKETENQALRALFLSNEVYQLLQQKEWSFEEGQAAKAKIEEAMGIVNEHRKYQMDSTEFANVEKNYKAVQKRLEQAVPLKPKADPQEVMKLFQQAMAQMLSCKAEMEKGGWKQAGEHIASAIAILTAFEPDLEEGQMKGMAQNMLAQAKVIETNIQKHLNTEESAEEAEPVKKD